MIGHDYMYPNPGLLWTFIGDHDEPRLMSSPQATIAALKLAYTCIFTIRGVPMLYYGDEIAMKGGDDPDNRHDFPGGWPGDPTNVFIKAGRTPQQNDVFEHVRKLAHLRTSMPVLAQGTTTNLVLKDQQWAFARKLNEEVAVIVFNNDFKPATIDVPLHDLKLAPSVHLRGLLDILPEISASNGTARISLPPTTAEIFTVKR
jgi:glycosidase